MMQSPYQVIALPRFKPVKIEDWKGILGHPQNSGIYEEKIFSI